MKEPFENFNRAVKEAKIVHMPKSNIATFGNTVYNYYFISQIKKNVTKIREGNLNVNHPLLVTSFIKGRNNMQGFPETIQDLTKELFSKLGIQQCFIEYRFENILKNSWEEKIPLNKLVLNVKERCRDRPMSTILLGDENQWIASLIKLCIKTMEKSFPTNLQEIEERGFLDRDGIPPQVYEEIERLFKLIQKDSSQIKKLGSYLLEHQLFEKYEERFFEIVTKHNTK